jgi:Xaa-Pro aminopeptidase
VYDWPSVDVVVLRAHRLALLDSLMADDGVDHALLTGFDNIRFATDYRVMTIAENHDWFAALVDRSGQSRIFVPFVDEEVSAPLPDLPHVVAWLPTPSWASSTMHAPVYIRVLVAEIERTGARRVGFDLLPSVILDGLRQHLPGVDFISIAARLFELRAEKHPSEVVLLEAVSRVNASAAESAMSAIAPGMTDYDVLAVSMESLQRQGVEYLTHSVCNVRQPSGSWFANGAVLRDGDAFFFDIGAYGQGGYASDICRTAFVGEPRAEVVRAYDVLLDAYRAGQDQAKPGVRVSVIHQATNDVLTKNGLPRTPYAVGHGIGLRACEWPTIYRPELMRADPHLQAGWTIALEPETFIEIDGRPVVLKVEDNFVVEANGLHCLSEPSQVGP